MEPWRGSIRYKHRIVVGPYRESQKRSGISRGRVAGEIVSWLLGDMACSHESWRDEWNVGVSLELFRMRSTHKLAVLGQRQRVHL